MSRKTKADLEAEILVLKNENHILRDNVSMLNDELDAEINTRRIKENAYNADIKKLVQLSDERIQSLADHEETKEKHSEGAKKTNNDKRDFWKPWKARYHELRASDVAIESARLIIQSEIIAAGGKKYALDGALKRQLK